MNNSKILMYGIDIFFCIILLPAMITLLPVDKWLANNSLFVITLIAWLYAVYFCIKRMSVPLFFKSKKGVIIAVGILIFTLFVTWLITQNQMEFPFRGDHPKIMNRIRREPNIPNMSKIRLHQQATWFMYLVTVCFSIAVGLLTQLHKQIMERQSIEFEKKKAELALYKAQINPHFLFNTLNTLYGLMITNSEKAETAFTQFIDLMKYMYTRATKDYVNINEETEYIKQYIDLQRNRIDEKRTKINYTFTNDNSSDNAKIAPMILITFVENAIKYGASSHYESNIDISIDICDGKLTLTTVNDIVNPRPENKNPGIGIINCRKRLDLLYPEQYSLIIAQQEESEKNNKFKVQLTINLHQPL